MCKSFHVISRRIIMKNTTTNFTTTSSATFSWVLIIEMVGVHMTFPAIIINVLTVATVAYHSQLRTRLVYIMTANIAVALGYLAFKLRFLTPTFDCLFSYYKNWWISSIVNTGLVSRGIRLQLDHLGIHPYNKCRRPRLSRSKSMNLVNCSPWSIRLPTNDT